VLSPEQIQDAIAYANQQVEYARRGRWYGEQLGIKLNARGRLTFSDGTRVVVTGWVAFYEHHRTLIDAALAKKAA
jgi:hypothetical protein